MFNPGSRASRSFEKRRRTAESSPQPPTAGSEVTTCPSGDSLCTTAGAAERAASTAATEGGWQLAPYTCGEP